MDFLFAFLMLIVSPSSRKAGIEMISGVVGNNPLPVAFLTEGGD